MLRFRFSSGLIVGLVVGVLAGVLIGVLMLPPRGTDSGTATSLQVIELTRKLEGMQEEKERADRQLEQFQKLADQMTTTFKSLEQRFNGLDEAQRLRETQHQPPDAKAQVAERATPTPVPTPVPPEPTEGQQDAPTG